MILAIETATDVCSVAFRDGGGAVHERRSGEKGSHSEKLFLFIRSLMEEHAFEVEDLEAVLVSEGPGSYTGLRIAASAVKGLLYARRVPLFAVNTLASLAAGATDRLEGDPPERVHGVVDARRVHLYHQSFRVAPGRRGAPGEGGEGGPGLTAEDRVEVLPIEKVKKMIRPGHLVAGTGLERIGPSALRGVRTRGADHISARSLLRFYGQDGGEFIRRVEPEAFDPRYYSSRQAN